MNFLRLIFGKKVNLQEVISNGATIIDVRTKGEYQSGHLKNSINIPVDKLSEKIVKLNKSKPIVTCCASGSRSASARRMLKSNGFEQVYNGGAWYSLRKYTS
jgi:rhodanese-related sulfurtransferase